MSASMIRRGLELLSEDIKDLNKKPSKGQTKKKKQRQQTPGKAGVMEMVSTNRQGVTKQVRRLQGRLGPGRSKATIKDKRTKSAVEEFRKTQKGSQLSNNLSYFLKTGFKAAGSSETMKILRQNSGRQSRDRIEPKVSKAPEEKSVFTEEEFQQFQKEYFGRTVEDAS